MKRAIFLGILITGLAAVLGACGSSDDESIGAGTGGPVGGSAGTSGGTGGLIGPTSGSGPAAATGGAAPTGGTGIGGSSGGVAPAGGTGGTTGGTAGTDGGTGGAAGGTGSIPSSFSFSGTVTNFAGEPIAGATVKLDKIGASVTTADDGTFTLANQSASEPDAVFNASLVVTQTGYLDYQSLMYNQPEASGMVIRMASADHPLYTWGKLYEQGSADFPSCHSASIVELPDGTLLSTYFGGSKESADDVEVRLSRKEPGQDWVLPIGLTDAPNDGLSVENPNIFQEREGKIFIFWKSTHGSPNRIGMQMTSTDGGHTWSEPRRMCDQCHAPEKNKAVQLEDGTILCPTSDRNGFFNDGYLYVEKSTDGGETWTPMARAPDGGLPQAKQPAIMFHADGRLQMMARSKGGKIPMVWSTDNGDTWSTMERSVLPANNGGIDATTLRDGRQFITYNHVPTPEGSKGSRCFLNAAISNDGVAWSAALVLAICSGGQFSYPAVIQSRDGLVHVVHTYHRKTIGHIVINPYLITDATTVPMPDGEWPTSGPLSKGENTDKEG